MERPPVNYSTSDNGEDVLVDSDGDSEMEDETLTYDYNPPQPDIDYPQLPAPAPAERLDRRARVEEVEDEEAGDQSRWIEDFPRPAGVRGEAAQSYFEKVRAVQEERGEDPWAPFEDEEEWELAQWLLLNVGQNATDKFLKLPIVSRLTVESVNEYQMNTKNTY